MTTTKTTTQYVKIKGKVNWVKLFKPDEAFGDARWLINLFPLDETEWSKYTKSGLQGAPKENTKTDHNQVTGKFIQLRRPTQKLIKKELVEFGPPKIYDVDGSEFEGKIIGNGSTVEATVCIYQTMKGPGHRLEAVRIIDLIVPDLDDNDSGATNKPVEETKSKKAMPWS